MEVEEEKPTRSSRRSSRRSSHNSTAAAASPVRTRRSRGRAKEEGKDPTGADIASSTSSVRASRAARSSRRRKRAEEDVKKETATAVEDAAIVANATLENASTGRRSAKRRRKSARSKSEDPKPTNTIVSEGAHANEDDGDALMSDACAATAPPASGTIDTSASASNVEASASNVDLVAQADPPAASEVSANIPAESSGDSRMRVEEPPLRRSDEEEKADPELVATPAGTGATPPPLIVPIRNDVITNEMDGSDGVRSKPNLIFPCSLKDMEPRRTNIRVATQDWDENVDCEFFDTRNQQVTRSALTALPLIFVFFAILTTSPFRCARAYTCPMHPSKLCPH